MQLLGTLVMDETESGGSFDVALPIGRMVGHVIALKIGQPAVVSKSCVLGAAAGVQVRPSPNRTVASDNLLRR